MKASHLKSLFGRPDDKKSPTKPTLLLRKQVVVSTPSIAPIPISQSTMVKKSKTVDEVSTASPKKSRLSLPMISVIRGKPANHGEVSSTNYTPSPKKQTSAVKTPVAPVIMTTRMSKGQLVRSSGFYTCYYFIYGFFLSFIKVKYSQELLPPLVQLVVQNH